MIRFINVVFSWVDLMRSSVIKAEPIFHRSIPYFSIVSGPPARVVGYFIDLEKKYFDNEIVKETYFDKNLLDGHDSGSANE